MDHMHTRRSILQSIGFGAVTTAMATTSGVTSLLTSRALAQTPQPSAPWLRKTLKIDMIGVGNSYEEKFRIARQAGFEGVEPNVPLGGDNPKDGNAKDVDAAKQVADMLAASKATGLTIDGTVGGYHWDIRHTDPDASVRENAADHLRRGIRQTRALGADTMLLVPGHGQDGSPAEVTERAIVAIEQVIPLLEEQNVHLLIENVWNHFLYDHNGGNDQSAMALAKFIDTFNTPFVGVQFDLGNHWKFGDPAQWIRTLGNRIQKLDIKGFSRKEDRFTMVTQGDIDWASVKTALREIKYTGWLAAEVEGGDAAHLAEVSRQLDEALQCNES
jgi:L-ribulose-5-phosphate 3-epimerase